MAQHNGKKWSSATIIGKVDSVGGPITHGTFTKREVLMVEEGKYRNPIIVEFSGDNMGLASTLAPGDTCAIHCKVRGREWTNQTTGKVSYFTSFSAQAIAEHDRGGRVPDDGGGDAQDGPPPTFDSDLPF